MFYRCDTEPSASFLPTWLVETEGSSARLASYSLPGVCRAVVSSPRSSSSLSIAGEVPLEICSMAAVYCMRRVDALWLFATWRRIPSESPGSTPPPEAQQSQLTCSRLQVNKPLLTATMGPWLAATQGGPCDFMNIQSHWYSDSSGLGRDTVGDAKSCLPKGHPVFTILSACHYVAIISDSSY